MILEEERENIYRALEKYDSHSQYFLPEEDLNTVNYLMSCLCDFLKADAEPVRHGHWIIEECTNSIDSSVYKRYRCSECGCPTAMFIRSPYCSNCGAKMEIE